MPDSENVQPTPNGDPARADSAPGPTGGLPQQDPVAPAAAPAPLGAGIGKQSTDAHESPTGILGRTGALVRAPKFLWAIVALLCVAAGTVASVIGAQSVANHDAQDQRASFQQSSAGIASALKLAIQREEELAVSASTFFARNPNGTPAEFSSWVKWARTLRRYPELNNLGLLTLVRAEQLPAFEKQTTGHSAKPAPAGSTTPPADGLQIVPPTDHQYYCLTAAELVRTASLAAHAGKDYCAAGSSLLIARDTGVNRYKAVTSHGAHALEIAVPVYRGNATPVSLFGRGAASVGWLREVIVPSVVLAQVLHGHPGSAVRLYRNHGIAFASGTPHTGAQSATVSLHNGWTLTTFAAPVSISISSDGTALALLIGGIIGSVLVGLLIFVIGSAPKRGRSIKARAVPDADLYDTLTGLPNRSLTLDRAERMVARARRQSGMLAGALFIDIDWFKDVNVKLGEAAGDQLLTIVADRLEQVVRAGDTVGRLGGDEFVVLVESAARGVRLDSLARRIIESLHKPVELDGFGPSFFATASIGVAFGRYDTPDDLLRDAQLALFAAKAAGKDRYTLFNANMRSVIESRSVLEAELNTALLDNQFFLLYEPVHELSSHRVVGLEALIRWQHPKQGVLAPDEFMPLAEDTGLVVPIGRWALEEACNRCAAWNVAGHRVGISVKVSPNQLDRDGFATDVRRALQQSGIQPSLLTLEIAETTIMREIGATATRLQEIKQLGVRIAIDDFGGSGYARHSDLQRLPLDFLKVDRNSLAASDDEDYRSWLMEAILVVGRDLKLTVIATGIESKEQLAALMVMGCTTAQGPFIGKPVPGDAVVSLISAAPAGTAPAGSAPAGTLPATPTGGGAHGGPVAPQAPPAAPQAAPVAPHAQAQAQAQVIQAGPVAPRPPAAQ